MEKNQIVYYARILPAVDIYELLELKIRTAEEDYFVGTEEKTQHAYLFSNKAIGRSVFNDRKKALKMVKEAEKMRSPNEETYLESF